MENCFSNDIAPESTEINILPKLFVMFKDAKYKSIIKYTKKRNVRNYFKDNSLEAVPTLLRILEEDFCTEETERCLEKVLSTIANVANIKEILLVLLEEVEIFRSNKQFYLLIKPIQIVLSREISKHAKFNLFSWVFNTLYTHIHVLEIPSTNTLEGDERKLLDCDDKVITLSFSMTVVTELFSEIYKELMCGNLKWHGKNSKEYFAIYLIKYLERPFTYLDIYKTIEDINNKKEGSTLYNLCSNYVDMIISLINNNPFKLLLYISPKSLNKKFKEETFSNKEYEYIKENKFENESYKFDSSDEYDEEPYSQLSLATFFYCILGQRMSSLLVPSVYSFNHLYLSCLPCCVHLMSLKETLAIHKGLILLENLLANITNGSLPSESLNASNHFEIMKVLVKIMIYHENKECRTISLGCFKSFIWKFDSFGCLKLMITIMTTINHSGIHAVVIHEFKEKLHINLSKSMELSDNNFRSEKLSRLFHLIWSLSNNEKTDLLEWSDKIMAALNLFIFLCIRDSNNITAFKYCKEHISNNFLKLLEDGLRLSKGHYKLKLKDLNSNNESISSKININIGNSILPNLPIEQEKEMVLSALNWFDVMQSVLARANKLMTENF